MSRAPLSQVARSYLLEKWHATAAQPGALQGPGLAWETFSCGEQRGSLIFTGSAQGINGAGTLPQLLCSRKPTCFAVQGSVAFHEVERSWNTQATD